MLGGSVFSDIFVNISLFSDHSPQTRMSSHNVRVLRSGVYITSCNFPGAPAPPPPTSRIRRLVEGEGVPRAGRAGLAGGGEVEAAPPDSLDFLVIDLLETDDSLDEQEAIAYVDVNVAQEGDVMPPEILRHNNTLDISANLDLPVLDPLQAAPVLAPFTPPRQQDLNSTIDLTESPTPQPESPASPISPCTGPLASLLCPVCLDSLAMVKKKGRRILSTSCGHVFCGSCLPRSLAATGCCPSCRSRCTSLLARNARQGSEFARLLRVGWLGSRLGHNHINTPRMNNGPYTSNATNPRCLKSTLRGPLRDLKFD